MADEWYYTNAGRQMGPVSTAELKQMAAASRLRPTDLVWREGLPNWVPASTAKVLFPEGSAAPTEPDTPAPPTSDPATEDRPRRKRREDDDLDERPRRRRRRDEDDDEFDDYERPRRRVRKTANRGLVIALIVGGGGVLLILGIIAAVILILRSGDSGSGTYTVNLPPGGFHDTVVRFNAGQRVEIRVTSEQNTDVDLYVFTNNGGLVTFDDSVGPNSHVVFTSSYSGDYRLHVRNLGTIPNRSHVEYH